MAAERVHVTGAGGQVGTALRDVLPGARYLTHDELDVTDAAAVTSALRGAHCVVHLAAMTHVDQCEEQPERALAVNETGTRNVCRAAPLARLIYLSTDYVFAGSTPDEYTEDDDPGPLNVYGKTKLAGEHAVLERPGGLVVRTSWVYGDGRNFLRSVLEAASAGRQLRVVDDQRGRPTNADSIAAAIIYLLDRPVTGVIHIADMGTPASWAEVADVALRAAGLTSPVTRITSAEYGAAAARPANSTLCLTLARQLGVPLRDWREGVERYARAWAA